MNYGSSSHHSASSFSDRRFANVLYTLSGSTRQALLIRIHINAAAELGKVAELRWSSIICGASITMLTKYKHSEPTHKLTVANCSHGEYIYCTSTLSVLEV